jgi:hypothetical protein
MAGNNHDSYHPMMFVLQIKAIKKGTGERISAAYLLTGESSTDVVQRLSYVIDVDDFKEIKISSVKKIRPKSHLLWMSVKQAPDEPSFIENRVEGSASHFQEWGKAVDGYSSFAIGIACRISAKNEAHALSRLGRHLSMRGNAGYDADPLSGDSVINVEELGERSNVALPRSQAIFPQASFVRG